MKDIEHAKNLVIKLKTTEYLPIFPQLYIKFRFQLKNNL